MTGEGRPLQRIAEGREAEIFAWQDGAVLRLLRNPGAAQQVEWEARAMRAARDAGVSVPAVLDTATVDGRPGLIMERIDGTDMLTLVGKRPWLVWSAGRASGQLQAALHHVQAPADLPELKTALARKIGRSDRVPEDLRAPALDALERAPDGDRICHGDFHPGNVIRTDAEPVVIDWTNVTRGDPDADLYRTRLMLRMGDVPPGSPIVIRVGAKFARKLLIDSFERAYRRNRPVDETRVGRWAVPVMAARLAEGIEAERPQLIDLLGREIEKR